LSGIDLNDRQVQALLRRLYYAHFASGMTQLGLDHEDVLQDIMLAVLARNRGKSPYTPKRGSVATYLYVVIQSVTRNLVESTFRSRRRNGDVGDEGDVAEGDVAPDVALWSDLDVRDLALEAGVPEELIARAAAGEDPWNVAVELVGFLDSFELVDRLEDVRP